MRSIGAVVGEGVSNLIGHLLIVQVAELAQAHDGVLNGRIARKLSFQRALDFGHGIRPASQHSERRREGIGRLTSWQTGPPGWPSPSPSEPRRPWCECPGCGA